MLKNLVILSVGLIFAILAAYLSWERIAEAEGLVDNRAFIIYATDANEAIARAGSVFSDSDLTAEPLPIAAQDRMGSPLIEATPENMRFVKLRPINEDVPRGRFLTFNLFEDLSDQRLSQQVASGMRLMTIGVNNTSSLNNLLRPGDRIDLLSVPRDIPAELAEAILEDVKIVAIGEYFTIQEFRAARRGSFSTITIEVMPEDGRMLAARREEQSGGFFILLRNRCDSISEAVGCN